MELAYKSTYFKIIFETTISSNEVFLMKLNIQTLNSKCGFENRTVVLSDLKSICSVLGMISRSLNFNCFVSYQKFSWHGSTFLLISELRFHA